MILLHCYQMSFNKLQVTNVQYCILTLHKMSLQIHFLIILPSSYYLVSRFHDMGNAHYKKMFWPTFSVK